MPTNEQQFRYDLLLALLGKAFDQDWRQLRVLDIGCHDGALCRQLTGRGAAVVGIDIYDPALASGEPWQYHQRELNREKELPFPDASFSVVVAFELLEHIIDTDFFLQEILRVLRPGGRVYISTPNINMLKNRIRVPLGLYPYSLEWRTVIHHVRLYNLRTLVGHLEQTGLEVKHVRGTHLVPQRFLGSRWMARLSDRLARWFPQLASNLLVEAEKPSGEPPATANGLAENRGEAAGTVASGGPRAL